MTNTVVMSGYIVRQWRYNRDRFLRLVVPRAPGLPAKTEDENGNGQFVKRNNDYITVRILSEQFGGAPVSFKTADEVQVTGYLQSRDYPASLADFMRRARGPKPELPEGFNPDELLENRTATEVVAQAIHVVERPNGKIVIVNHEPLVETSP